MGGENMNSLTKAQQELVSQNLPVVHWVICDYIHVNPTICGLEIAICFKRDASGSAKLQPLIRMTGGQ